jgi:phenylalanine ammonia-lyase
MTIISSEIRTTPRRSSSASNYVIRDGIVRLTAKSESPRTMPVRKLSKLVHKNPVPTALVEEFVQSCRELDSYK